MASRRLTFREGVSRPLASFTCAHVNEANGLLTPSLKVKRLEATRRLASVIDEVYGGPVQK